MSEAKGDVREVVRGKRLDHLYQVSNDVRGTILASRVKIAGTSEQRKRGLLGLDSLDSGAGLWIAPCEAVHTLGMQMPIDVIFLDRQFRVKKLVSCLKPFRIAICLRAYSVLELKAGVIAGSTVFVNDQLRFKQI